MDIQVTTQIVKEDRTYIAYSPELDLSSCGGSKEKVLANLKTAVRLFLEEAGYLMRRGKPEAPKFISMQRVSVSVPLVDAKV
jgi:predicted RNase H-like HicB family nuclease